MTDTTASPILDLVTADCLEFTLTTDFSSLETVSDEVADQLQERMQETDCEEVELIGGTVAHYGTALRVDNVTLIHAGVLTRLTDEQGRKFGVTVMFKQIEEAPTPPLSMKPFADLLEVTSSSLGVIRLGCKAEFSYEEQPSLRSRIQLPSPLLLGRPDDFYGFTHIESVCLSQRKNGAVTHRVEVSEDDDRILHTVHFLANLPMTEESLQGMFEISSKLSRSLLHNGGES